ncbi:MAG: type II secretion system F family protein [Planctomycetes bacterium]|nr:type II secretion system F family protein [Planctomycetota bacterium]
MDTLLLVPVLTFVAIIAVGLAVMSIRSASRRRLEQRLEEQPERPPRAEPTPTDSHLILLLEVIGDAASMGRVSRSLTNKLSRAGHHSPGAAKIYLATKAILTMVGFLAGVPLAFFLPVPLMSRIMMPAVAAGALSYIPNIVVDKQRRKRVAEIRLHLPDAIDLLEICIASGMALDMAWNMVGDELGAVSPRLADEMALVSFEISLGTPRTDAMRHMADRTGIEDINSMVTVLIESDKFGTSIGEALRTFAASVRDMRRFRAEEAAEKATVKLLFPMVMFIFPTILIVLVGPAVLRLAEVMGKG